MTTTLLLFVLGGALLAGGAEMLVRGASRLAVAGGISPLVVGLTVVAFGTSAPELAVTLGAAYTGEADVAVGNVVGSNIANVLLILGLSAAVAPLAVAARLVRLEVPLMIGASVLVLVLALDGRVGRLDGLLLFAGLVAYLVFVVRQSRREEAAAREAGEAAGAGLETVVPGPAEDPSSPDGRRGGGRWGGWPLDVLRVTIGLALLVAGARWLVAGAVAAAAALGVSELVIGLTIVAVGTSLPELATSVLASLRGERDIAVGNAIGSNLFNLLAVLGLGGALAPAGLAVPRAAVTFDLPVMIAVAFACLPIFFTGHRIARGEGWLFVAYYAAYTGYLVLASSEHAGLPVLSAALLWFALSLAAVTLAVLAWRAARAG
jgi:cation:H+ antiporter